MRAVVSAESLSLIDNPLKHNDFVLAPNNGNRTAKNVRVPNPPIHCVMLRNNNKLAGNLSVELNTDVPVVVNPDVDSNIASCNVQFGKMNKYGNVPMSIASNHPVPIIANISRWNTLSPWLRDIIQKNMAIAMLTKQQNVHFDNNALFLSMEYCVINDAKNMHDMIVATTDNARRTILLFIVLL